MHAYMRYSLLGVCRALWGEPAMTSIHGPDAGVTEFLPESTPKVA